MNLKEIITGTIILAAASFGAASNAEAQFPSTCMPATCGPKVVTRYEAVTEMVTVPRKICEQQEFRYQVPVVRMEERTGVRNVERTVCQQVPVTRYIPHQVCVNEPQPCAPVCAPNTCMPKYDCAPRTCEPRCNDRHLGKYFGEFCDGVRDHLHQKLDNFSEWRIENKYRQIERIREREIQRDNRHQQRPLNQPYGYYAPAYAAPCGPDACSPSFAPNLGWNMPNPNWNAPGFNRGFAPMPGYGPGYGRPMPAPGQAPAPGQMYMQPAPNYEQDPRSDNRNIPEPPVPAPDTTTQQKREINFRSASFASNDWRPASE